MNITIRCGAAALALACASGTLLGATRQAFPDSIASLDELNMTKLAESVFPHLPLAQQVELARKGAIGSAPYADSVLHIENDEFETPVVNPDITANEYLDLLVSEELADRMSKEQWNILHAIADSLEAGKQLPHLCFSPDTDREYAFAVNQLIEFPFQVRFQQTARWTSTATNGGGLTQGTPTTLTYSFVPDGTLVPDLGIGLGSGNSQLFAWLDGLYGETAIWQGLFDQIFGRWGELINVTYVYEPTDDGVTLNSFPGQLGVRGDVRIAAFNFQNDGNGGVLAYNNFPNDGDMVIDAFDTFYNVTGSNSLRMRNVLAHEHGHGLGMLHVCPANQTKLMEPFISVAYDGPQLDDILNGIRHYGDLNEPDNSIAEATDLGSFNLGGLVSMSNVGIDDNTDKDYYRVGVNQSSRIVFTVGPDAATYNQGPQTSSCNTGALTDYNTIQNLQITAVDASGNTIAFVNNTGLGESETMNLDFDAPGEAFFIVDGATSVNNVQRYQVSAIITNIPFMGPVISADAPQTVQPGVLTPLSVTIDPREDNIVPGSAQLFVSVNGGAFTGSPLVDIGGNEYTGTLPIVNCGDTLSFYLSVEGDTQGVVTLPEDGAALPYTALVGEITMPFADNFQTDMGWIVTGITARAAGGWERGVPNGDGSRGDPPSDADGSGSCYLTGNGNPGSDTDVDGGQTILTSPAFDVAGENDATISYSRWYDNTGSGLGNAPGTDIFTVQISDDDGGTWTDLEIVGPSTPESSGGWFSVTYRIADFVTPTAQVRVRFIAEDVGDGSVVEAAVDAVKVTGLVCQNPQTCAADLTGDGLLDFFDVSAFLVAYQAGDLIADFNGDGVLDFFDVSAFIVSYQAGCP